MRKSECKNLLHVLKVEHYYHYQFISPPLQIAIHHGAAQPFLPLFSPLERGQHQNFGRYFKPILLEYTVLQYASGVIKTTSIAGFSWTTVTLSLSISSASNRDKCCAIIVIRHSK